MTAGESQPYSYPSGRNRRPEDVEDIGMYPPQDSAKKNPLSGLVRAKPVPAEQPTPALHAVPTEAEKSSAPHRQDPTPSVAPPSEPSIKRDLHRGSTAMLPVSLVAAVDQKRSETNLSAGTIVVQAIEKHFEELPELLRERTTTNAAGFQTREKLRDPNKEKNTTVFSYRLSGTDFDTLDSLVATLGARDRTHLMRTALTASLATYIKDNP